MSSVEYVSQETLCCPVCDFDYNHFDLVKFIPDSDRGSGIPVVLRSARGTGKTNLTVESKSFPTFGRGGQVSVRFHCEGGHRWGITFSFHKGNMTKRVWVRETADSAEFVAMLREKLRGQPPSGLGKPRSFGREESDVHRQARSFAKRVEEEDLPSIDD
jgi:hypothetical protein